MLTVTVDFEVSAADRPVAIKTLQDEGIVVRGLWGNLGFGVWTDPAHEGKLRLTHEWADISSFDAYKETPAFKDVGAKLFPMMVGKPSTIVHQVVPQ
jgi:quinol monooxygenase YgiN